MTINEIALYNAQLDNIRQVALHLHPLVLSTRGLTEEDYEDICQQLHLEAPALILEQYEGDREAADRVRAFLFGIFRNRVRDRKKQLTRREAFVDIYATPEDIDREGKQEYSFCESSGDMAKFALESVLPAAELQIRELCHAYLEFGSWDAAGRSLGWSNGRIERTKKKAIAFFREKIVYSGGFFDIAPKRK